jgi:hypothetical protein
MLNNVEKLLLKENYDGFNKDYVIFSIMDEWSK